MHPLSASGADAGSRCTAHVIPMIRLGLACLFLAGFSLLLIAPLEATAAETNLTVAVPSQIEDTNAQAILQAFQQIQQQLHATQLAIEQNRQEIKEATVQQAAALSTSLQTIQDSFAAQRARDLETMQAHNKLVLILVSAFAGMGFLTMLMMSYFQWRMSKGLAEISAALPAAMGLGHAPPLAALGPREPASARLIGTSTQQQKPTREAESTPRPALKPSAVEVQHFPDPDTAFRRRQLRALRTAVIVGLICAAALALLFYFVTYRKLGFGYLHGWFQT
jgi:hypothetical protein